ncbi:MAG: type II toxin-antitoxin system RelE/ParE family toxin [Caulobacteraceae bacterium]
MTVKPIVPREQACRDIEAAADYYAGHAGEDVALDFIDELERAYRLIAAKPATGSPFYGHELGLPGLRQRRLKRYPYLIFYIDRGDHVDVWRVLHAQRDIPARMQDPHD